MKAHHLLILPTLATAFFPTKFRDGLNGRPGTSHQSLTITSLTELVYSLDTLSSNFPTLPSSTTIPTNDPVYLPRSVVSAIRAMARAAAEVDVLEAEDASWHFDGEEITQGQLLLGALRSAVVDSLQGGKAEVARILLGKALHGVQDFYAHTNWLELGKLELAPLGHPVDLESAGPMDGTCSSCSISSQASVQFAQDETICQDCTGISAGAEKLTSGFFVESSAKPLTGGKCRHGGPYDDFTHGVGNRTSAAILSQEPALINATGTAAALFPTGTSLVNATISLPPRNNITATELHNLPAFVSGINKDSMDCLWSPHNHLHSDAVSFASAASKQFVKDLKDELSPMQLRVLFGLPEEQLYHVTSPVSGPKVNSIAHFSTSTIPGVLHIPGSKTHRRITYENYDPISMLSMAPIVLTASRLPPTSTPATFPVPVDSHMSFLSIGISCTACSIILTPPDATAPLGSDWQQAVDATGTHARMNVTEPQVGMWTLELSGSGEKGGEGNFAVVVEGESPVHMAEFAFVESAGRSGHEGYFEIGDAPPVDTLIGAMAEMYGPASEDVTPVWVIRGADYSQVKNSSVIVGDEVAQIPVLILEGGSGEEGYPEKSSYFGLTKLPQFLASQPDSTTNSTKGFYVYVTGIDDNDRQFQRVHPIRFTTSQVSRQYKIGSLSPLFGMVNGTLMNSAKNVVPVTAASISDENPLGIRVDNSTTTLSPFSTPTGASTFTPLIATAPTSPRRNTTGNLPHATGMTTGFYPIPSGTVHYNTTINGTAHGSGTTEASGRMTGVTVSAANLTGFNRTIGETATLTMGVEPTSGGENRTRGPMVPTSFEPFLSFSTRTSGWMSLTSEEIRESTITGTIMDCTDGIETAAPETSTSLSLTTSNSSDFTDPLSGYGTLLTSYSTTSTTIATPASYTVITSAITSTSTIVSTNIITSTLNPYEPAPKPTTTLSSYGVTTSTDNALGHTHTSGRGPEPSVIDNGVSQVEVGAFGIGVVGVVIAVTMLAWA